MQITDNARRVLEARYLRRDEQGRLEETPEQLFRRVARGVAQAEAEFHGPAVAAAWEDKFFAALSQLDFLPNSPTLMNAGTPLGQLSACFVLPVADSMEGIFDALKLMALIQQSGGGTGFAFSRLRPRGDRVASTGGQASGPISFMRIFDCATENIRQGGKRRGANMGILRVDHPDIEEFIEAKLDGESFRNFNLSVAATDEFMQAALGGGTLTLRHPKSGMAVRSLPAGDLFERITQAAWQTGDPGLVFIDAINRAQPTPALGEIEATNPCGEVPLLPNEACNLASINLSHMVRRDAAKFAVDWDRLAAITRLGMRFLDDVIQVSRCPSPEVTATIRGNRKVGLGVMGFAGMLIRLGITYGSGPSIQLAEELMRFIAAEARTASLDLAKERGIFPNWEKSIHARTGDRLRNATLTSIAPTGTISILADTSAGIEPLFALAYHRHALDGQQLHELNPLFLQYARQEGFYSENLLERLTAQGTVANVAEVPPLARGIFRTALEIPWQEHLNVQAAFQKHVDNSVSKTINLPQTATAREVADIYRRAWEMGLKGITVFRYGCKGQQVLELGAHESPQDHEHFAHCDPLGCKV